MRASVQVALCFALYSAPRSSTRVVNIAPSTPELSQLGNLLESEPRPERKPMSSEFDYDAWTAEFEEKSFEQQVDHTNAYHQQVAYLNASVTFPQRYWINFKAWGGVDAKAPIFVIPDPYGRRDFSMYSYGFIGEMSRDLGALVVMVEGRFAPGSMPFAESGFDRQANRIGLMSAENALRDYVMVVSHLRDTHDPDWVCPTGAVGISLSGMYAAWLRYKFPNVFDFAVASGAPMIAYPGTSDHFAFGRIITEAWLDAGGQSCNDLVRESFIAMLDHDRVWDLYSSVYVEVTYEAHRDRGRIPKLCQAAAAAKAQGLTPLDVAFVFCGERCQKPRRTGGSADSMWDYLWCTQVMVPNQFNGVEDFLFPSPFSVEVSASGCKSKWGVEPQAEGNYHADLFGWHRLPQLARSTSGILFAYGTYDPWTGYALSTVDISDELPVVMVKRGTHGGELKGTALSDTLDYVAARERILTYVRRWVLAVQG